MQLHRILEKVVGLLIGLYFMTENVVKCDCVVVVQYLIEFP